MVSYAEVAQLVEHVPEEDVVAGSSPALGTNKELKGLSQEKLARLADVANNTLIKMESGENKNPTLETLKKVAKALEVSVDDIIK